MSTSTLPDADRGVVAETVGSPWLDALDPRGTFVTFFLAVAGTVAVVVLTATALRLVTGS